MRPGRPGAEKNLERGVAMRDNDAQFPRIRAENFRREKTGVRRFDACASHGPAAMSKRTASG